jgi:hypothetical protein
MAVALLSKTKTPAPFVVPPLAEVNPELARLQRKKTELQLERRRLADELQSLAAEQRSGGAISDNAVETLIGSPDGSVPAPEDAPGHAPRRAELRRLLRDLDRALIEIDRRIAAQRPKASATIMGNGAGTAYRSRVCAVCEALLLLHDAHRSLRALTEDLNDAGVGWTSHVPVLLPTFLGDPKDFYSRPGFFLREAAAAGYLDEAELPQEFRAPK